MQVSALEKGGSQRHGGPAPPLLTHSLALPDCSSWKGGEQQLPQGHGQLVGMGGLQGYEGSIGPVAASWG